MKNGSLLDILIKVEPTGFYYISAVRCWLKRKVKDDSEFFGWATEPFTDRRTNTVDIGWLKKSRNFSYSCSLQYVKREGKSPGTVLRMRRKGMPLNRDWKQRKQWGTGQIWEQCLRGQVKNARWEEMSDSDKRCMEGGQGEVTGKGFRRVMEKKVYLEVSENWKGFVVTNFSKEICFKQSQEIKMNLEKDIEFRVFFDFFFHLIYDILLHICMFMRMI